MSEANIVWIVRGIVGLVVLVLLYYAWRMLQGSKVDVDNPRRRPSALDRDTPLPPSEMGEFDAEGAEISKPNKLNPEYFSKSLAVEPLDRSDAPHIDLPLAIMARYGQTLSGEKIDNLVHTFGLRRSPAGVYELIGENGRDVLFSMLNVHKPGTFAENLAEMAPIDGVFLVLQLPNSHDAVKDFETFSAIASEMSDACDGRLCDFNRRPVGESELMKYRQAAEDFQKDYDAWLQAKQKA